MKIHPSDNVEVLLQPRGMAGGKTIPMGHKIALRPIKAGEMVIKYGQPIGHATTDIKPGDWVHSHNLATNLEGQLEYTYNPVQSVLDSTAVGGSTPVSADAMGVGSNTGTDGLKSVANPIYADSKVLCGESFQGYLREDGRVGVRNELWIIPTVGCVADFTRRLAQVYQRKTDLTVRSFEHNYGCSQLGGDHESTRRILAQLALHPNAGGVLVVGLGCENNRLSELKMLIETIQICHSSRTAPIQAPTPGTSQASAQEQGQTSAQGIQGVSQASAQGQGLAQGTGKSQSQGPGLASAYMDGAAVSRIPRVRFIEIQKESDEMQAATALLDELNAYAKAQIRTEQPLSKLCIGLKCGGSDGFSGITANPLLGQLSDYITARGAISILTEVPEMFGAETLLMNRCKDRRTFEKTVNLINNFKQYYLDHDLPVGENPSPGNKEGGITTLEEKSLGCVQKGGTSVVTGVLDYGEMAVTSGLNLLCAPGNDLVASTALAASGCQIVLFTTGRGTPFGTCVPTLKVSTNNELAALKPHWIDFNAGVMLEQGIKEGTTGADIAWESNNSVMQNLLDLVIRTANGQESLNEQNGYSSIAIWKTGVTL